MPSGLLTLTDEILQRVISYLPAFPIPVSHSWLGPDDKTPLVELDANLRSLCGTKKRLRKLCTPTLYETVVLNLEGDELELQRAVLMSIVLSEPELQLHVRYVYTCPRNFPCTIMEGLTAFS